MSPVGRHQVAAKKAKVLVVEDEIFIRLDMCDVLRKCGFSVVDASTAEMAIDYLESGQPFDLLFTDIQLPGQLNGLALAERVRHRHPAVPVVITSGNLDLQLPATQLGRFVAKPYDPNRVAGLMPEMLSPDQSSDADRVYPDR